MRTPTSQMFTISQVGLANEQTAGLCVILNPMGFRIHIGGDNGPPGMTDPGMYDELPESCARKWRELEQTILDAGVKTGKQTLTGRNNLGGEPGALFGRKGIEEIHYVFISESHV